MKARLLMLCLLSAALLSLPWLVPHTGALALVGFVPLLVADWLADRSSVKRFWLYALLTFTVWNALTTFWVCNATLGGGIFAIVANALQMTLVWVVFRFSKKYLAGVVPYVLLVAAWLAWERRYFDVDISWPWLTLGNAFAASTRSVQWYEFTGTLGGSLWIWLCNMAFFGVLISHPGGAWASWNKAARTAASLSLLIVVTGPLVLSKAIYDNYEEKSEGSVKVIIGQPNFDPYEKFSSLSQKQQTEVLLGLFESELRKDSASTRPVLLIGPETFTSDVILGDVGSSATLRSFRGLLERYPGAELLIGASTYDIYPAGKAPSVLARRFGDGWIRSHNSALLTDASGREEIYHKSRLVVGTELTPYPKIFVPLDDWLSDKMGSGGLMGRCEGQDEVSVLHFGPERTALGCAVCYESVYGEFCADYVRKGAKMMAVITNDAWWGDTPGYRQHLSYSALRAIELRRDIARCGNTGISCIIDQRGEIHLPTPWWERATLSSEVNLNSGQTFFVRNGDIAGRVCTLVFLLLAALLAVRVIMVRVSSR